MSLAIFNYKPTLEEIDRVIGSLRSREWDLRMRQFDIAGMNQRARDVMKGKNEEIERELTSIEKDVEKLSDMKIKIRNLTELPDEMKNKLYAIYKALGKTVAEFAVRLPICYEGMLIEIAPPVEKGNVENARALYKKYEALELPKYYLWVMPDGII